MLIVRSLYASLQGHSLWCNGKSNEFVWQLKGTETFIDGYRELTVWPFFSVTIDGLGELSGTAEIIGHDNMRQHKSC